ncbi:MAG: cytochrome C [Bacteroidetes bacterium]|nr:cytochrome C [Bacteroidota bacterium]
MKTKRWAWILGGLLAALVFIVIAVMLYIRFALPNVPLQNITVQITPERVARGQYFANHVTVCMDCHSKRAWDRFSGPPVTGTIGKGGEIFDRKMGFPGAFSSPNITPFKLNEWTDAEIYRAITSGENKDGNAMFPIMPYFAYGTLDNEDIFSIIAYIRSIPSIHNTPPPSNPAFPMNLVVRTFPRKANPATRPPESDTMKYGEYLVRASGCIECHTTAEHGQIVKELAFSGGREFIMPNGVLTSPNITPDMETGIGKMGREDFIKRFKGYDPATYNAPKLGNKDMPTIMPWTMYAGMNIKDLGAIYAYLHSLPAKMNVVVKWKPLQ